MGEDDTQGGEFFWGRAGAGGEKNWQAGWGVGWAGGECVRARQVGRGSVAAGVVGAKGGGPRIRKSATALGGRRTAAIYNFIHISILLSSAVLLSS